jgi:hypothetical protein
MMAPPSPAEEAPAMAVGRIFHIEGDLLRYVPEEKDWVAVVRDAPFGAEDTLFSGSNGMAELIVPNGIWIRTGNSTQIQFITLDADLAEMDVASGMGRFYSKGSQAAIKVTSPFGYVLADPGTIFDLYVGENSIEVVAIKGTVRFVHQATDLRYDVAAGTASILADPQQVSLGNGTVDPDWNRWNMDRENFWLAKGEVKGPSVEYLPPGLRNDAYAFEENGTWERVPYEGEERWFWRPTTVAGDWSPFTVGRWTDWYGDQTWIPAEPFGYVTHHYGNWIYVRNRWYWAPPMVSARIGFPLLDIGFFWCPGRVAWIHSGVNVGWVPLAPRETYYSRRHWGGPHMVVVNNINVNRISINTRSHVYVDHAIIVNRSHFLGRDDYRNVRVINMNRTAIINNYRSAPVVNNTVINNYTTNKQRYNYTNVKVNEKPNNTVINRIQQNQTLIREGRKENASVVQERVKGIPEGRINREVRIDQPRVTNRALPARDVNQPKSEIKLQQREINKRGEGGAEISPGGIGRPGPSSDRSGRPVPPAQSPERVAPARPAQGDRSVLPVQQPTQRPERAAPDKPAQADRPVPLAQRPERMAPARPAQEDRSVPSVQPAQRPERAAPERPAQADRPVPPAQRPERVAPAGPVQGDRPVPPVQPTQRPERSAPDKPAQADRPVPPAQRPERVAPAKPVQVDRSVPPGQPTQRPERAAPDKPAQADRPAPPAQRPERMAPAKPVQVDRSVPPVQPAQRPERAAPERPAQVDRPAPPAQRPEQAAPASPAQPQKPVQSIRPAEKPERVIPAKPGQQEKSVDPGQPAEGPDRRMPTRPGGKIWDSYDSLPSQRGMKIAWPTPPPP